MLLAKQRDYIKQNVATFNMIKSRNDDAIDDVLRGLGCVRGEICVVDCIWNHVDFLWICMCSETVVLTRDV